MKEQKMKEVKKDAKKKSTGSGIPALIILAVLGGTFFVGWWLYSSSKPSANTNTNQASANQTRNTPPVNAPLGASPPNMLGSPTAAVTIEEFADFQCGSCAAAHPVLKEVQSIYGSKIKFVFRNYPLSIPAHDKAFDAAAAVEAAGMQGKFWMMQDQLFQNQMAWSQNPAYKQLWSEYATKIGLDVPRFQADAEGLAARGRVELDMARGRALGVSSTPTVYINGQIVPYPEMNVGSLRRIVDAELQKAAASQGAQTAPAGATAPSNANN